MKRKLFLLGLAIIISVTLFAQPVLKGDLSDLDKYYKEVAADWNVPGFTVAIVKDGEIVFSKGYGLKEEGKMKSLTGTLSMQLPQIQKLLLQLLLLCLYRRVSWTGTIKW